MALICQFFGLWNIICLIIAKLSISNSIVLVTTVFNCLRSYSYTYMFGNIWNLKILKDFYLFFRREVLLFLIIIRSTDGNVEYVLVILIPSGNDGESIVYFIDLYKFYRFKSFAISIFSTYIYFDLISNLKRLAPVFGQVTKINSNVENVIY